MKKRFSTAAVLSLCAVAIVITYIFTASAAKNHYDAELDKAYEDLAPFTKLLEINKYVTENYVGEIDEDALMELVLEAGADDLKNEDDVFEITAEPEAFDDIEAALGEKGIETVSAEVTMVPDNTVKVEGDAAVKMQKMLDALDENDDVQEVYGNYEMDEE